MTITIEPKEIAELFELLAPRDSAKEIMQTVEDNLPEVSDKIIGRLAKEIGDSFSRRHIA